MKMRSASPLDLLKLVHPIRDVWICLVLIPRISTKQDKAWIPNFKAILQEPTGNKDKQVPQIPCDPNKPHHIWLRKEETWKLLKSLKIVNCAGWDIYYSLGIFAPGTVRRFQAGVQSIRTIYLDFDTQTAATQTAASEAFCKGKPYLYLPPPHAIVQTSPGKCQCLWQLDGAYPKEDITASVRELADLTGANKAATDANRVFRLPGYYNNKYGLRKYTVTAICDTERMPLPLNRFQNHELELEEEEEDLYASKEIFFIFLKFKFRT